MLMLPCYRMLRTPLHVVASCAAHHGQAAVLDLLGLHAGAVHASGVEGEGVDEAGLQGGERQQMSET